MRALISRMRSKTSASIVSELLVRDLTGLELQLRLEQPLALPLGVVDLGVGNRRDLVEHERDAVDQEAVEKKHQTRSSFNLMFTKL